TPALVVALCSHSLARPMLHRAPALPPQFAGLPQQVSHWFHPFAFLLSRAPLGQRQLDFSNQQSARAIAPCCCFPAISACALVDRASDVLILSTCRFPFERQ